jgi:putative inorganic carbon (HCO3(-)) transporter
MKSANGINNLGSWFAGFFPTQSAWQTKVFWVLALALLVIIPFDQPLFQWGITIYSTEALLFLLVLAWIANLGMKNLSALLRQPHFYLAMPFLCVLGLAAFVSADPIAGLKQILRWAEFFLVFWIFWERLQNREQIRKLVLILVVLTTLLSIYALVQVLAGPESVFNQGLTRFAFLNGDQVRAMATFGHSNQFAGYVTLVLPLTMVFFLTTVSVAKRWLFFCLLLLSLTALIFTYSRAGWLVAMLGLVFVGGHLFQKKWPLLLAIVLGMVSVVFLIENQKQTASVVERLESIQQYKVHKSESSINGRLLCLKTGFAMWKLHPFLGYGPGNYKSSLSQFIAPDRDEWSYISKHIHNAYLQIIIEAGLLGFAAFFLFIGFIGLKLVRAYYTQTRADPFFLAFLAGAGAFLLFNLFDVLFIFARGMHFAALLALSVRYGEWMLQPEYRTAVDPLPSPIAEEKTFGERFKEKIYPQLLWGSAVFLALAIPFDRPVFDYGITIYSSEIILTALIFIYLAGFVGSSWRDFFLTQPVVKTALPFLAALCLSSVFAYDKIAALKQCLRWLEFIFAIWIFASQYKEPMRIRKLLKMLSVLAAALGLLGIAQTLLGPHAWINTGHDQLLLFSGHVIRAYATFGHSNQFAGFLVLFLPLTLAFFLAAEKQQALLGWGAMTLILFLALGLTYSRGGFLAALFGCGMVSVKFFRVHALRILLLATLAFAGVGAISLVQKLPEKNTLLARAASVGELHKDAAIDFRFFCHKIGWTLWLQRPLLGHGPGNYKQPLKPLIDTRHSSWQFIRQHLHNLYLQLLVEVGMVGLLTFIFYIVMFFIGMIQTPKETTDTRGLKLGILASVTAFLIHNFFDDLFIFARGIHFAVILGLGFAIIKFLTHQGASDGK